VSHKRYGTAISATLVVLVVASAGATYAAAQAYTDNMYPMPNANWGCVDGALGDGFCKTDNRALTTYRQGSLSSAGRRRSKR
jgi:hypothetical protein